MIVSNAFNRISAYNWYLGSAFWRGRREHILKRANHTCEKCGKRPATEVHHLTYIRIPPCAGRAIAKFIGDNRRTITRSSSPSTFPRIRGTRRGRPR